MLLGEDCNVVISDICMGQGGLRYLFILKLRNIVKKEEVLKHDMVAGKANAEQINATFMWPKRIIYKTSR